MPTYLKLRNSPWDQTSQPNYRHYGWNARNLLAGITNGALDTTGYTLSADGRRTGITRNGSAESYGYDNARQVTSADYPDLSSTQSWNYDAAGNRSAATINGITTTYLANAVNEYTSISGGGFQPPSPTYDPNGNTLNLPRPDGTALSFVWDINNQLIAASNGNGDSASYQYDALGRRVKTTSLISNIQSQIFYFHNGWNVELEHNGSDYTRRMTWGLDLSQSLQGAGGVGGLVMVEQLPSGGGAPVPSFPTYDGNGNITAWVNASGSVVARQRYDAYGNIIAQTGMAPCNYGFSTKPMDQVTGLYYYGYRYYDPVTGRWPSRDLIEEAGGLNLYAFVGNNGVNKVDLLGLYTSVVWVVRKVDGKNMTDSFFQFSMFGPDDGKISITFSDSGVELFARAHNAGLVMKTRAQSYLSLNLTCNQQTGEIQSDLGSGLTERPKTSPEASAINSLKLTKSGKTASAEVETIATTQSVSLTTGTVGFKGKVSLGGTFQVPTGPTTISNVTTGSWECVCLVRTDVVGPPAP